MINGRLMHSVVLFLFLFTSCAQLFTADKAVKAKDTYTVPALPPQWKSRSPQDGDYMLTGPLGASLFIQSFCGEFQGESLPILARKTFKSLDQSKILEQKEFILSGRSALKSSGEALVDGVRIRLHLINTKRNNCYYDFLEILPMPQSPSMMDQFIRAVKFK